MSNDRDRERIVRAKFAETGQRTQDDLDEAERARKRREPGKPKVEPISLEAYFHKGDVGHLVVRRAELEAVLQKALSRYHHNYHQKSHLLDWERSPVLRALAWVGLFLAIATGRVKQGQPPAPEEKSPQPPVGLQGMVEGSGLPPGLEGGQLHRPELDQ